MALLDTVDTLDVVAEGSRKFYTEVDGKFVLDPALSGEIKGLKTALDTEKNSAKERAKALKDYETKYAGIDPDKSRKLQEMFENNEEAQLIAQGKTEEVFQKRTEKWRQEEDRVKLELNEKIVAAESRANAYKDRVLDDAFRAAASQITDIHQSAVDVMLLGHLRTIFSLDDNGHAVQKDGNGNVVLGKDGKTPFSPKEYLEGCRPTMPYLFKVNSSGSPQTGKQVSGVTKDLSGMKPTDRLTAARESMQRK